MKRKPLNIRGLFRLKDDNRCLIREMEKEDIPAWVKIFNSSSSVEVDRYTLKQANAYFRERFMRRSSLDLVAVVKGRVIGYKGMDLFRLSFLDDVGRLNGTFVHEKYRRIGVATTLWDVMEKKARALGIRVIFGFGPLPSNYSMRKFMRPRRIKTFGTLRRYVKRDKKYLNLPITGKVLAASVGKH